MGSFYRRVRQTLSPLAIAAALIGCTSGSESVPIPGADDVITAPLASVDLPPVNEPPVTEPPVTVATSDGPVATVATTATHTSAPSTTAAPPPTETTAAPPATDAPAEDIYLRIGDEGPEVGLMQLKLSVLEYLPAGSDTGVFDEATQRGLRLFQSDYGLGVDGIFGPLTGRSLNAAVQSVAVET